MDIELKIFTGNASRQPIYEFLEAFEIKYEGADSAQKALTLYDNYLGDYPKRVTQYLSKNYDEMKQELVKIFGTPKLMCKALLDIVKATPLPTAHDDPLAFAFYGELQQMFATLRRIREYPQVNKISFDDFIYDVHFISCLLYTSPSPRD